ncbi:TolC family outer membrane protein [Candidatus Magnetaquicoccus inordinatus]|uniref:TolC family outer membrane protein n=1 Tax=Candidatus Magnetaquicoccus inordinatus TaxID=2496818 RepID=UPI00187D6827|nr:TolC family outer membrane protein [Candidatus Magnetaquicoccus inordinatus]
MSKNGRNSAVSRTLLAMVAGMSLAIHSAPAESMTMREAVELAVKTYPEVQAAEEYGKSLDQKVRQAYAGYLPRLDFTAGYGRERSDNTTTRASANRSGHWLELDRGETGVLLKQNLFDGFDTKSKVAQAKAQLKGAQARVALTSDNVALQAVQAYVELVMKHIQLELIKDNVLLHQRILSKVQRKYEGGAGPQADVHQAKSRTYLASANHASNQAAYKNAQAKFTEIIGLAPLTETEMVRPQVPEDMLPKSVEEALEIALRDNPELGAARLAVLASESGVNVAKAGLMPKIDLELSGTNNANVSGVEGHSQSAAAMLRMNYNAFAGGADMARISEQRNLLEQAKQLQEKTQRALEENTRESWNKLTMAQTRIGFMRQHYEVSKQVTASYHDQFKMGKRTLLDVLNSENELFAAKNGLLVEELTYIKSAYELFARMGSLQQAVTASLPPAADGLMDKEKRDIDPNRMEEDLPKANPTDSKKANGKNDLKSQITPSEAPTASFAQPSASFVALPLPEVAPMRSASAVSSGRDFSSATGDDAANSVSSQAQTETIEQEGQESEAAVVAATEVQKPADSVQKESIFQAAVNAIMGDSPQH